MPCIELFHLKLITGIDKCVHSFSVALLVCQSGLTVCVKRASLSAIYSLYFVLKKFNKQSGFAGLIIVRKYYIGILSQRINIAWCTYVTQCTYITQGTPLINQHTPHITYCTPHITQTVFIVHSAPTLHSTNILYKHIVPLAWSIKVPHGCMHACSKKWQYKKRKTKIFVVNLTYSFYVFLY